MPGMPSVAEPCAQAPLTIEPLEATIRRAIEAAIAQSGGSIPRAAAALDVAPSTLYRRLQAWENGEV